MFVLYKSSAGSGKTFTLVKSYLRICLKHPDRFQAILAITFTNKAAAEMKTRIIQSVHHFVRHGHDDIIDLLINEGQISRDEAREHAVLLLERILHRYSEFSVMTIDAFIGRVVRTFARDLELPLKFDVELDTKFITGEILELLIGEARAGNFTGEVLTQFALAKMQSSGSWALDNALMKIGDVAFSETHVEALTALRVMGPDHAFWRTLILAVDDELSRFRNKVNGLARDAMEIITRHELTVTDFAYGKGGAAAAVQRYTSAASPKDFEVRQRLREGKWQVKSTPEPVRQRIDAALNDGLEALGRELVDTLEADFPRFISHYLVSKNVHAQALVGRFLALAETYKTEKNRVPLSDFSRKVADVVRHEPVPFLYWRLGNRYTHMLIDEFQDTSRLQWMNLAPLVEEALAKGFFSMAVGDGKQAIYRWRAGDVTIMETQLPRQLGEHLREEALANNYRSRKEIVDFNNAFFTRMLKPLKLEEAPLLKTLYAASAVSQIPKNRHTGFVRIAGVDMEDARRKSEKTERILSQMAIDIEAIISEQSGYGYGDMAVLVRSNRQAALVAQALFSRDIPVISPDSLLLVSAPVVRFLISALRYLASEDRIALLNMWLFMGESAHTFEMLSREASGRREIEDRLSPLFFRRRKTLLQRPVYETLEELIALFELNHRFHGFLQGLLETALAYSEKFSSEISGFLTWWDLNKQTDKATLSGGAASNAVSISTVHKSKGLEYPIVFLPFSWPVEDKTNANDILWVSDARMCGLGRDFPLMATPQQGIEQSWFAEAAASEKAMSRLDNVNLLYVALTRASDRLYAYVEEDLRSTDDRLEKLEDTGQLLDVVADEMAMTHDENMTRTLGAPAVKISTKAKEALGELLPVLPVYDWRRKITMKRQARELWRLDASPMKEKVDWGVLVHEVLAGIETEKDIAAAVAIQREKGHITMADTEELIDLMERVMEIALPESGRVRQWFSPGWQVKNEMAIGAETGEFRPDRVILRGGEAIVIDYKTGRPDPKHHGQVQGYAALLKTMGYTPVQGYLLYTADLRVEAVQ